MAYGATHWHPEHVLYHRSLQSEPRLIKAVINIWNTAYCAWRLHFEFIENFFKFYSKLTRINTLFILIFFYATAPFANSRTPRRYRVSSSTTSTWRLWTASPALPYPRTPNAVIKLSHYCHKRFSFLFLNWTPWRTRISDGPGPHSIRMIRKCNRASLDKKQHRKENSSEAAIIFIAVLGPSEDAPDYEKDTVDFGDHDTKFRDGRKN